MKNRIISRSIAMMALIVLGCVDLFAKELLPFGVFSKQPWTASVFYQPSGEAAPDDTWMTVDFKETVWQTVQGPLSSTDGLAYRNTLWEANSSSYYVRRHFTVDNVNADNYYYLYLSYDDGVVVYLNGEKIFENGSPANYTTVTFTDAMKNLLKVGDNVLAVRAYDSGGGAKYVDFGLYEYDEPLQSLVSPYTEKPITIINDEAKPWVLENGAVYNGNRGQTWSKSALTAMVNVEKEAEFTFEYNFNTWSSHQPLEVYVDNKLRYQFGSSGWAKRQVLLGPGEHEILFVDSIGSSSSSSNYTYLRNFNVREFGALETVVVSPETSKPITFQNDDEYPWTIEGDYIQNSNYGYENTVSKVQATFEIDVPSKLSYEYMVNPYYTSWQHWHHYAFKVNGNPYELADEQNTFIENTIVLEPGKYTIQWVDSLRRGVNVYSQVKNVKLSDDWINVELPSPGTLGTEALYQVNILNDIELLKVKGQMNSTDWATIKKMVNIKALDLTEARFDALPNNVFDGIANLSYVTLPEGLKTIGEYAFRGTRIWDIKIPSTVTTIGKCAFEGTRLTYLTFKEGSQLKSIENNAFASTRLVNVNFPANMALETIGSYAFSNCAYLTHVTFDENSKLQTIKSYAFQQNPLLVEFVMPNSVITVERNAFASCASLTKLWFSDNVETIPVDAVSTCGNLTDLHLPNKLKKIENTVFYRNYKLRHVDFPENLEYIGESTFYECGFDSLKLPVRLTSIGNQAFYNCDSLKYIELPSYIESYYRNFNECSNVETVVCQSATPPTVGSDPFINGRDKTRITLVVPSFAVVNYKLDPYWYQFGYITEGDDIAYWKITNSLSLVNNRRMNGTPDVDIYYGGQLTVGGSAPMKTANLNFFFSEDKPGNLLNNCETMTAESINTYFSVNANKWYFITPLHDVKLADITHSDAKASFIFRYYDCVNRAQNGTGASWKNVESEKLMAGQGYIFQCNANGVITLPAEASVNAQALRYDDVTVALNAHDATTSANKNWNYIGNPYPCYYDIYQLDFTAPITVWTGSTYKAYSIVDDELALRPMQSFFVQKPDELDNIIFRKEGRQVTSLIEHVSYVKPRAAVNSERYFFNLSISGENKLVDETRVVVNEKAQLAYEINSDASKFMSMENGVPQIFTLDAMGNSYAINERPLADGNVSLGFRVAEAGFYTIKADKAEGVAILYDCLLNKSINLSEQGEYVFYSEPTENVNNTRFILKLATANATGIETPEIAAVYGTSGSICIDGAEGTNVAIYNVDGRNVGNHTVSSAKTSISMPAGTYVVKMNNDTYKVIVF